MPDRKPDSQPADPAWERISAPNCSWGAAPFWHPQQERVYWVDRVQNRIWRLHLPSGRTEMWQLEQTPGCLSPCRSGALLLALRDGIYLSQAWHDIAQRIVSAPYDTARQRFHEGCCDPWGRLWIDTRIDEGRTGRADLYCLHKNRWWQTSLGPLLDAGAFVAGLEYAAGVEATVLGKPSPAYFEAALSALDADPELAWMVGDDIEADMGAQKLGMRTVLVRTGKFRPEDIEGSRATPDIIVNSIADLPDWLERWV